MRTYIQDSDLTESTFRVYDFISKEVRNIYIYIYISAIHKDHFISSFERHV